MAVNFRIRSVETKVRKREGRWKQMKTQSKNKGSAEGRENEREKERKRNSKTPASQVIDR